MNKPPHNDDDIDAWLDRREPLFRRSRADDDLEPPNEIDNVVLAKARAALRNSQREVERRSPLPAFFTLDQWTLPLGLAATLIVAVAVVVRVNPDEASIAGRIQDIETPASRRDADESAVAIDAASAAADEPAESQSAPAETAKTTATVAAPQVARPEVAAELSRSRSDREEKLETEAAPNAAGAAVSVDASSAAAAAPQEQASGAFAAPPAPPAAPPPADARANQALAKSSLSERRVLSAPAGASSMDSAVAKEQDRRSDPLAWYQHIVELRASGNTAAADKEWRELKARYPSFVPPDDESAAPR